MKSKALLVTALGKPELLALPMPVPQTNEVFSASALLKFELQGCPSFNGQR